MKRFSISLLISVLMAGSFFLIAAKNKTTTNKPAITDPAVFKGLTFRNIGPALTAGRISDVAIHPKDRGTWYAAVGSGGVWKTVNAGTTWETIFDSQPSYSIGCVAIDPNFHDVIWVGTGENVSGRHVGYGDGVYKSLNGGKTWKNMGLEKTEHISMILIDPRDSNTVYVVSEGPLWSSGGQRGVYKSIDGGKSWQHSLNISKDTGVVSAAFEPGNPDIIYVAAYQRRRSVAAFMGGGPESGIYKSTDAGKSWRKLTIGLPKGHMGRIGLAVSPIKPNVVYATIEASRDERGFYRSADRGESWQKRNSYLSNGTGPHYYQEIFADPFRFDHVYQMDVWMHITKDGGKTFHKVGEQHKHSDNHALAFDPTGQDPDYLLAGCDGGLYQSFDHGATWKFVTNMPITQFYKMAVDNHLPFYNIVGGTQDNGTQIGPSRTINRNGIMTRDWFFTLGADGYACAIDPKDPNIIYGEWQVGGLERYDKRSGQSIPIQPRQEPGEDAPRWNWDSPLLISPHSHTRLYYGSQRLYRSDDRGDSWTSVSPDLSRGIFRLEQPIMGRTWSVDGIWDHAAMSFYGNLTAITESPLVEGLIYVGTDDGLIQVTDDGGKNWRNVNSIPGVPKYYFVNDIKASLHDENTVFAALDNHKTGDLKPYLVKSTDRGRTWTAITGDLPHRHIVWAIAQDHVKKDLIFIGTEFAIFVTLDGGKQWLKLNGGVPPIPFRDIEIQSRENDLVGASFGRSFFVLDDYTPLRLVDAAVLKSEATLFPVKKTPMYMERWPFDLDGKGMQGDNFYIAPNPPFGAVFTYYLKESLKTRKQQRRDAEKKLEKQGKPLRFPGWDAVHKEEWEDKPAIVLTVKDEAGNVVRRINGPLSKGFHRVAWNLRYPPVDPTVLGEVKREPWDRSNDGPMVVPGTFTVSLAKKVNGILSPLGKTQSFTVESLGLQSLPAKDRKRLLEFQKKAGELQRAMMATRAAVYEALRRLKFIKKALTDTPKAGLALYEEAIRIETKIRETLIELAGDPAKWRLYEPVKKSLAEMVNAQLDATTGISKTQEQNYNVAATRFPVVLELFKQLIDIDLKNLEKKMEDANAPWTPGRKLPTWKK